MSIVCVCVCLVMVVVGVEWGRYDVCVFFCEHDTSATCNFLTIEGPSKECLHINSIAGSTRPTLTALITTPATSRSHSCSSVVRRLVPSQAPLDSQGRSA